MSKQSTYISKNFTFEELFRSETAVALGINNTPNATVAKRLEDLVVNVLQPLRDLWGAPIIISSGYRCNALNAAVGGSPSSQHMLGEAVDIRTKSDTRDSNMALLKCFLRSGIEFDELISEDVNSKYQPNWIHVSYTTRRANRKKKLTMKRDSRGRAVYYKGINI